MPRPSIFAHIVDLLSAECSKSGDQQPTRFQCELCPKTYLTFLGLSKHLATHDESRAVPHTCPKCFKDYTSGGALKMHLKTHSLPCVCAACGKAFSRPWLLKGHLRTHTGERPYACGSCSRRFADRSNLRAHEQTHKAVRRHRCAACTLSFARAPLLARHIASCHTDGDRSFSSQPRNGSSTSSENSTPSPSTSDGVKKTSD